MKLLVNCRAHARGALLRVRRSLVRALALGFAFAIVARGTFGQAVSPIDFSDAPLADTRIGVAIAAMDELADAPALLARSSSQRFIDDAFARIAQTAPADVGLGAHLVRWRAALRVGERPFDREAAYAAVGELSKSLLRAVGSPRDKLIALGILAEQTSYNARVLRDPAVDGGDRAAIGANDAADGLVPGLRDLRERVATLGYKEWSDVADGAQKIVAALLGSTFAVPFPASPGVWLVLLRTRPTPADARRRAEHYWLDIVRYDGAHQTIGAYPNGMTAYDRDAHRLLCAFDKEPDAVAERTIPVVPGPATTSAQLAATLVRLCTAERTSGLQYRVKDADDDRFIADALFRAGVSVAPLLRAAAGH